MHSKRRIKRVNEVGLQANLRAPGRRLTKLPSWIFWFGVFGISRPNSM
jgi:hypothetical protein